MSGEETSTSSSSITLPSQVERRVVNRHDGDFDRMNAQSQVWERVTRRALDQAGLQRGAAALDAGCGAGDVMRLIAEKVGNTGQVTGLDIDVQLCDSTWSCLQSECPGVYRSVHGDVLDMMCMPGAAFDLVFARLLLFHMPDPLPVLRRLWQWVKPGGVLVIMDYDLTGARSVPQHPAIERTLSLINGAFRRAERDIEIGSRMPALFVEAGIDAPDVCEVNSVILAGDSSTRMLRDIVHSLRSVILRERLADAATLQRIDLELVQPSLNAQFMRWPDLITTSKRKSL